MDGVDDHYAFLGLPSSATDAEIQSAIERVSEQAIALVYTSPQRSSDLWERIRQMRRDLLATPEGRQVYDEALARRRNRARSADNVPSDVTHVFRPTGSGLAASVAPPAPSAPASVEPAEDEDSRQPRPAWPYALIAAAAVFVAVAGALLAHSTGGPVHRQPALALSQQGTTTGSKFVSGGSVLLAWHAVPGASGYRVQIATAAGDPTDAAVFAHGSRSLIVRVPHYRLKVAGPQVYYWRVQARVAGHWRPYSRSIHFAVARPEAGSPVALRPVLGTSRGGKHVRLCWSPVVGAIAYRLRVEGSATRTVQGTCATLSLRPRVYHWSVAALVKGVGVYTGRYSVAAALKIPSPAHTRKNTNTRRRTSLTRRQRVVRHTTRHGHAVVHHTPVEIAFAPRKSTTGSSSRAGRSTLSRTGRVSATTSASTSYAGSASASARYANPFGKRPAVATRTVGVPSSSARSHTTGGSVRTGSTATAVSGHSTSHVTHRSPTAAPSVPLPPPPPPVPPTAGRTATQAPSPTSGVAVTGVNTSLSISPPLVTQYTTTVPATARPTATTAAGGTPPSPTAGTGQPPVTVPTSSKDHPDHPAHPDHPDHPTHPTHP